MSRKLEHIESFMGSIKVIKEALHNFEIVSEDGFYEGDKVHQYDIHCKFKEYNEETILSCSLISYEEGNPEIKILVDDVPFLDYFPIHNLCKDDYKVLNSLIVVLVEKIKSLYE